MKHWLKKRCTKCGTVREVRRRQRRCYVRQFGPHSYCCWGKLEIVRPPKIVRAKKEAPVKQTLTSQEKAQKKLEQARKKIVEKTRAMARLATQLRQWERRVTYYAGRASMTDAELAHEKAAREYAKANRTPKRRAIKL